MAQYRRVLAIAVVAVVAVGVVVAVLVTSQSRASVPTAGAGALRGTATTATTTTTITATATTTTATNTSTTTTTTTLTTTSTTRTTTSTTRTTTSTTRTTTSTTRRTTSTTQRPTTTTRRTTPQHERGNVMTLYHTTSPEIAELILKSGFRPGSGGWCGGAIYFLGTPVLPKSKFGPVTKTGAIIEAQVDMGRMAHMGRRCDAEFGRGIHSASAQGYDSVTFNPGDGDEYVISSNARVLSMRLYSR